MSDPGRTIEHMFDTELRSAGDAAVVAAIEQWAGAEAAASARRLAAIAELARRRCGDDDRALWACDSWDAAAAEVAAALGLSQGRASGQMHLGVSLYRRLPQVAALFADGVLSYRVVSAIIWRTELVQDEQALTAIDAAVADHARAWGPLSDRKLEQAVDMWVDRFDPGALRRIRSYARDRNVEIGSPHDTSGTSALWGRLYSTDAAILDRRLMQMARGVCDDDPRTFAQRRADALGALAAGSAQLSCLCGSSGCEAAGTGGGSASAVVIHVLAESPALQAEPDPHLSGEPQSPPITRTTNLLDLPAPEPEPEPTGPLSTSVILGGGIVPGPLLAELIRSGATVRHLRCPQDEPEPRYRPSEALMQFVRARDLTCRFPNCDVPAEHCDVDHTNPWPIGPTHPSNLKCECRKHHLLKTFWVGEPGWLDEQFPDGTVRWTSPTGRVYTTLPGSRLFFPAWDSATGDLGQLPRPAPLSGAKDLRMPLRSRTRTAERARRIRRERALNAAHLAERAQPPPF